MIAETDMFFLLVLVSLSPAFGLVVLAAVYSEFRCGQLPIRWVIAITMFCVHSWIMILGPGNDGAAFIYALVFEFFFYLSVFIVSLLAIWITGSK